MHCLVCGNYVGRKSKPCSRCGALPVATLAFSTDNPRKYIAHSLRVKSRRRLYFGCALIILGCVLLMLERNYIVNLIKGPTLVDGKMLETELTSGKIKNVSVNLKLPPGSVFRTGYGLLIDEAGKKGGASSTNQLPDAEYYITPIGEHLLVLQGVPNQRPRGNFLGVILPLAPESYQNIFDRFSDNGNENLVSSRILKYQLANKDITDLVDYRIFLAGVALVGLGMVVVIRRLRDLDDKKNYIYSVIPLLGYFDIDDVSEDFVASCQMGSERIGICKMSKKYIYQENFFFLEIFPISQLYWGYKVVQRHVSILPFVKIYTAKLYFKPNKKIEIYASEKNVDHCLKTLASLNPQAKFGYNKNIWQILSR